MRIISFDPGLTTGVGVWHDFRPMPDGFQIPGRMDLYQAFEVWTQEPGWSDGTIVVCENYIQRAGALTHQPDAPRIIGYLEGRCHFLGWPFELQNVSNVKAFATNDKLKKLGWWVPGQDHARDALRHLLYYLVCGRNLELAGERDHILSELTR